MPPKSTLRAVYDTYRFRGIIYFTSAARLHVFVWINSGHGIQLDQVPEVWLLQDWMCTSVGRVNPVVLDPPVIYQVSVFPRRTQFPLACF